MKHATAPSTEVPTSQLFETHCDLNFQRIALGLWQDDNILVDRQGPQIIIWDRKDMRQKYKSFVHTSFGGTSDDPHADTLAWLKTQYKGKPLTSNPAVQ